MVTLTDLMARTARRCRTVCMGVAALVAVGALPLVAAAQTGSISGVATRASDGAPVAGVSVRLYSHANVHLNTRESSADGTYAFPSLEAGIYKVVTTPGDVAGSAYLSTAYTGVVCADLCPAAKATPLALGAGQSQVANLALVGAASISGGVLAASTGAPLIGATVELHTAAGKVATQQTDGAGAYRFALIAPGTYYLRTARTPGYVDQVYEKHDCEPSCASTLGTTLFLSEGQAVYGVDFALPMTAANGLLEGKVTNVNRVGVGVRDVVVEAFDSTGAVAGRTVTASDGAYALSLEPGLYFVRATPPSRRVFFPLVYPRIVCLSTCNPLSGTPVAVVSTQRTMGIDLALAETGAILGTVRNATDSAPIAGALVQAYDILGQVVGSTTTLSAPLAGQYFLSSPAPLSFVVASMPSGEFQSELYRDIPCDPLCASSTGVGIPVPVGVPYGSRIDFTLDPAGSIRGTVVAVDSNAPLASAEIRVHGASGQLRVTAVADSLGAFTVNVPAGTYFLTASAGGHSTQLFSGSSCPGSCSVTNGTPVIVSMGVPTTANFRLKRAGTITGTVSDGAHLVAFPGGTIEAYAPNGTRIATAAPDPNGAYVLTLSEGTYYLRTRLATQAFADQVYHNITCAPTCHLLAGAPVTVFADRSTSNIDFHLSRAGSFMGRVTSRDTGEPLESVSVHAHDADGASVAVTTTDGAGHYRLTLPAGRYYASTVSSGTRVGVVYANRPCLPVCATTSGDPVDVTAGADTGGIDFLVDAGGMVSGNVTGASGAPLPGVAVGLYGPRGNLLATEYTAQSGDYAFGGLPAGLFYLRTFAAGGYVDEVYDSRTLCLERCAVTSGTPVTVSLGQVTSGIDFGLALAVDLIRNGTFDSGTTTWRLFAAPTPELLQSAVESGELRFWRLPGPLGAPSQASILQETGAPLAQATSLLAQFDIRAMGTERKRVSVLIHDSDFSDLAVCSFWVPTMPQGSLVRYAMRMTTTQAWTNATISFYAATTATSASESLVLDNVSLQSLSVISAMQTECVEPAGITVPGGAASPEMLINGDFASGAVAPGWTPFGEIQGQVTNGVYEFVKGEGAPSGVLLQPTGQPVAAFSILTSTLELGNSSLVRKRVTVLLHDRDFSDFTACTFWIAPGQPLTTYTMRAVPTRAWADATLSVYPSTTGAEQWIRLDNVTLQRTPGAMGTAGTTCEPSVPARAAVRDARWDRAEPTASALTAVPSSVVLPSRTSPSAAASASITGTVIDGDANEWEADGFLALGAPGASLVWLAVAPEPARATLTRRLSPDADADLTLTFRSWLDDRRGSSATVQISADGVEWETIARVSGSDTWATVDVDLTPRRGSAVFVRFVFDASAGGLAPDTWRVEIERP